MSNTVTFSYTGAVQTWTVPSGVTSVTAELWGAQGVDVGVSPTSSGGKGGYLKTTLAATPGDTWNLYVGGSSASVTGGSLGGSGNIQGGQPSGRGGDGTDIRVGGTALANRVAVAGGGGGGGWGSSTSRSGGGGGGGTGGASVDGGQGGTQTAGGAAGGTGGESGPLAATSGALGAGGDGGYLSGGPSGGGGGGGYYGGGGGGTWNGNEGGGGGGGSSYTSGTIVTNTQSVQSGNGQVTLTYDSTPSAPTLTAPTNATYVGTASGLTFTGVYNSTDGESANARAMRVKSSGGTYSYYNASTNALQSTIVWNPVSITPGGSASFTLPAAALTDGTTYNWSMADQEAGANLQGVFASDFTFTAQAPPTVTVTAPSGSTSTATPIMQWTATPDTGASITAWQAKVFSSAQYGAAGFDPATSTATWDSGVTAGSATSTTVGVTLVNGVSYRFYVHVTETGGETSAWVYSAATVAFDPPAPPIVTATAGTDPTTGLPLVNLTVQGTDNLLSVNDASMEGGVGSWGNTVNASVAQSTAQALDGSYSLAITATAAGDASASTGVGTAGYPVQVGQTYTATLAWRAAATPRTVNTIIEWYNAAGTLLSSVNGNSAADSTTGWTATTATATAPTGAAFVAVKGYITTPAASEVHYVDEAGIRPGSDTGWYRGGLVGSTTVAILRSDGLYVRGASTTNPLTIPSNQQASLVDAELVPANGYTYIGSASVVISPTVTLTGPSSQASAQVMLPGGGGWWEFDPTDLSTAIAAQVLDFNPQITEQATAHTVLGQATPNVIANAMGGVDGTATFETFDTPTYLGLTKLLISQKTVFISDPFGDNQGVTYVRFGPQTGGMSGGMGLRAKDAKLHASSSSAPHHELSVTWVAAPRVPV